MEVLVDVTVTVTASGDPAEPDELASLRAWLQDEPDLRGRMRLDSRPPDPGSMSGGLAGALTVALGPGAGATVFASALISWIRHRTGSAHVRVRWPDGAEIEYSTDRVRSMDAAAVQAQVMGLLQALEARTGLPPAGDGPASGLTGMPP
jgi:Effector Associated Constant Component 1